MHFRTLIIACLFLLFSDLIAQRSGTRLPNNTRSRERAVEADGFTKDNLFIEPLVGLNISQGFTQFNLRPYLGYSFTNNISAGVGGGFGFIKQNGFEDRFKERSASMFLEVRIIGEGLLGGQSSVHGRAEFGNVSVKAPNQTEWTNELVMPVGGGIRSTTRGIVLFNVNVMYNLLYKQGESIFQSPFIYQPSVRWYFLRGFNRDDS